MTIWSIARGEDNDATATRPNRPHRDNAAIHAPRTRPELALFGIDGMYLEGRTLIAIQNGTA